MNVIGPAPSKVSVMPATCRRLRRTVNSPSSVISCRTLLVGAAVVDVTGDVLPTVVVTAVGVDAVVEAVAVDEAESDPFPHEAMIIATQLRLTAKRRPLTVRTLS